MTQEQLAERAGLGVRTIQGLERDESRPLAQTIERLVTSLAPLTDSTSHLADVVRAISAPAGVRYRATRAVAIRGPDSASPCAAQQIGIASSPSGFVGRVSTWRS